MPRRGFVHEVGGGSLPGELAGEMLASGPVTADDSADAAAPSSGVPLWLVALGGFAAGYLLAELRK
jgi:hypothetical protein